MTMRHVILVALLLTAPLAGCLDAGLEAAGAGSDGRSDADPSGRPPMTAYERVEEQEGAADPRRGPLGTHVAERIITVTGEMRLDHVPVVLETRNGNVDVRVTDAATDWRLVLHIAGYGASPEDAREVRDSMDATWAHVVDGVHVVHARVAFEDLDRRSGPVNVGLANREARADVVLELPRDVVASVDARTRNGDATAEDLLARDVRLETRNGDAVLETGTADAVTLTSRNGNADARAVDADTVTVKTRNGNALARDVHASAVTVESRNGDAEFRDGSARTATAASRNANALVDAVPTADGRFSASTRNGDATVTVPETATHGYDVRAETRNGKASVALDDGSGGTSDDGDEAWFRTAGYRARDVHTEVHATSRNGNAHVGPR